MRNLINWKELSRELANNETSISRKRIPKKYRPIVEDLLNHIDVWMQKTKEEEKK